VERVEVGPRPYQALNWGGEVGGGIVECGTRRPSWLPYVEVPDARVATEHARRLGASVLLELREGPAGWRSVVAVPDGAEIAFWEPKVRSV
jgi:predicted enzyme related to lactoylglutathione lyase